MRNPEKTKVTREFEGWYNLFSAAKYLGISRHHLERLLETFRETRAGLISSKPGGVASEYYHPDLIAEIKKVLEARPEKAPEGWMTVKPAGEFLGINKITFARFAAPILLEHPDWSREFVGSIGQVGTYYHPDLIAEIKKVLEARPEKAPEGWMTVSRLANNLNVSFKLISNILQRYKEDFPTGVKSFLDPQKNQVQEFIHPDLVELVTREVQSRPAEAPEGWLNNYKIALLFKVDTGTVRKIIPELINDHPEWKKSFLDGGGRVTEYYHPDLIAEIKKVLEARPEKAPEGWMTQNELAKSLERDYKKIGVIARDFFELHPEWIRVFLKEDGLSVPHYHPDLIAEIKKVLEARPEKAPEGWKTESGVKKIIPLAGNKIHESIQLLAKSHPNWKKIYLDEIGHPREHYSPELISEIKKVLEVHSEQPVSELEKVVNVGITKPPEGWKTLSAIKKDLKTSVINELIRPLAASHPEWIKVYLDEIGHPREHYHPDLIAEIKKILEARPERVPEGWENQLGLSKYFQVSYGRIGKIAEQFLSSHPEWFKNYLTQSGKLAQHYHPGLIAEIKKILEAYPERAPEGWLTNHALSVNLKIDPSKTKRIAEKYRFSKPGFFKKYSDASNQIQEHYSPELVALVTGEVENNPGLAPEGWLTVNGISRLLEVKFNRVKEVVQKYRLTHPEWFKKYLTATNDIQIHCDPELVNLVTDELKSEITKPPEGWKTQTSTATFLNTHQKTLKALVDPLRVFHPEWFKVYLDEIGHPREHFHPDLITEVKKVFDEKPQQAPKGWLTESALLDRLNDHSKRAKLIFLKIKLSHPEWVRFFLDQIGHPREHYGPEFIELAEKSVKEELVNDERQNQKLQQRLEEEAKKIADGSSPDADQIRKLIAFFGESSVVDIIFQLHPEFKDIDIEVARGILGEYLGNFLNVRGEFNPDDLKLATEFLGNVKMAQILKEALKRRCLEFYYKTRKANEGMTDNEIVIAYFENMVNLAKQIGNLTFSEITLEVSVYFEGLFKEIEKPAYLVDSIVEGRAFPDINQRVNTQELREKKRLYIADEMGLGKSASAIFAKETLGCKTAVLVVPKGLIPTWKRYLSDDKSKGGYFKPGLAPKVLVVESTRQIQAGISGYDYVIVAQEKLNQRDVESIKLQNPDMLIVDEMHKLKKPKGKRSDKVLDLATSFRGEDKYLALLSGTPIPNTVRDLAVTIKILYPEEEAADLDPRIIATSLVIPGNVKVGKLRGRLLERMQMKRLEDSVEMPPKAEIVIPVELGEMQAHLYEAAVEQDEIEGSLAKMDLLNKVLLNPRILDTTPGIENAKQRMLEMTLRDSLKRHNKIVVFVNHQVDGVLRGDFTILDEMDLGPDVKIHRIHGDIKEKHRDEIQQRFQTSEDKEVVFIFGRVSDVGVDFSHGQAVYFYNDPWTQYDKNQQIARVWRPGVRGPVEVGTLRVPGTIDEGLAFHIEAKYRVVEKILRGIPLSEVDKRIALSDDDIMETPEADVNPELAKYYYNAWKRMLKMFIHHREQGEEKFKEFLKKYGAEYARSYIDLSARSYQANVNRFAGTLIGKMIEQQPGAKLVVDMASGPDMLRRHMKVPRDTRIISVDLNPLHFQQQDDDHMEASFIAMPIPDESVDFCNLALALHYTRYVPTKGDLERLNVFREMNRVLKIGGRAIISELYSLEMKDSTKFEKLLDILGFEIVREFSGRASSVPSFSDVVITIEKKRSISESAEDLQNKIKSADLVDGLKFKETQVDSKLKDVKMVVTECDFNGQKMKVNLNEADEVIRNEEQTIIRVARELIRQYGGIGQIPREEVIRNGFARWSPGEEEVEGEPKVKRGKQPKKRKYLLFRKLHSGPGIVMLKG